MLDGGPNDEPAYAAAITGKAMVNATRRSQCDERLVCFLIVMLSVRGAAHLARLNHEAFWNGIAKDDPTARLSAQLPTYAGR